MNDHVIDCCSLLNLWIGWRDLAPLQDLKRTWHICEAVVGEAQHLREFDKNGAIVVVPLDLKPTLEAGVLIRVRPESDQELEDYVSFATEVDDGEAQAIAIAKSRGFILLTDDRKAGRLAAESGVRVIGTPNVLRDWAGLKPENNARLPDVTRRITTLARFRPPANSADYEWWKQITETG